MFPRGSPEPGRDGRQLVDVRSGRPVVIGRGRRGRSDRSHPAAATPQWRKSVTQPRRQAIGWPGSSVLAKPPVQRHWTRIAPLTAVSGQLALVNWSTWKVHVQRRSAAGVAVAPTAATRPQPPRSGAKA